MERMKLTTNNSVFHDLCLSKRRWSIKFGFYTNNWKRDRGIGQKLNWTQLFSWVISLKPKVTILAICWRKKLYGLFSIFCPIFLEGPKNWVDFGWHRLASNFQNITYQFESKKTKEDYQSSFGTKILPWKWVISIIWPLCSHLVTLWHCDIVTLWHCNPPDKILGFSLPLFHTCGADVHHKRPIRADHHHLCDDFAMMMILQDLPRNKD